MRGTAEDPRSCVRVGALLAVGAMLLGSTHSHAQPTGSIGNGLAAPAVNLLFPGIPIPRGGVLILDTNVTNPGVRLTSESDPTPIEGTLEEIDGTWIWRPNEPLEPDTYNLSFDEGTNQSLVVEGTHDTDLPELRSEPSVSLFSELERVCCSVWNRFSLMDGFCFALGETRSVDLHPGLSSPEPLSKLSQRLFRVRATGEASSLDINDSPFAPWGYDARLRYFERADEYCFELDVLDLVTGETQTLDDLTPRCAEHGELGELGLVPIDVEHGLLDPQICHAPPPELTDAWCANAEDVCEREPRALGCELRGYVCRGEPLPSRATGLQGPQTDASVDERDAAPPNDDDQAQRDDSSASCSATTGARPRSTTSSVWLAALALLLARRPRPARATRTS